MSKNIIPQGGNKSIQAPVGIGKSQKIIEISSEKVNGILDFLEERNMSFRKLDEYLECLGLDNIPNVISQIEGNKRYILGSLKERFLNHQTPKLAVEIIELTKTMDSEDTLITLYWGYNNFKEKIQKIFEEAMINYSKLMIEKSKDMELKEAIKYLTLGIRNSSFRIQKIFIETIVDLIKKLNPKEAIYALDDLMTFVNGVNKKIIKDEIIFHSQILIESAKKLEKPEDTLNALDSCFHYSHEVKNVIKDVMIEPTKAFIESTKKMPQKSFFETLKGRKGNYIKNSIEIGLDILKGTKKIKDILEKLEEGLSFTKGEARNLLIIEIIAFIVENIEPEKALKTLEQKQKLFQEYNHEIPAEIIINLINKKRVGFRGIVLLYSWLNNTEKFENKEKYANEIVERARGWKSKTSIMILNLSYNKFPGKIQKIFEEAMIEPIVFFVEATKNMPQKKALEELKWLDEHSVGKANELIKKESIYRSNLSELNQLIRN